MTSSTHKTTAKELKAMTGWLTHSALITYMYMHICAMVVVAARTRTRTCTRRVRTCLSYRYGYRHDERAQAYERDGDRFDRYSRDPRYQQSRSKYSKPGKGAVFLIPLTFCDATACRVHKD